MLTQSPLAYKISHALGLCCFSRELTIRVCGTFYALNVCEISCCFEVIANRCLSAQRLLMLHIIGQLLKGGKVEVTQIDLPNRTPKAITHAWAGLKTEIKKLQDGVVPKQAASGMCCSTQTLN
jgi:hypothetical protein